MSVVTKSQANSPAIAVKRRVFVSYKRNVQPDQEVALALHDRLSQLHDVFIDQEMPVGTPWAQRIENELRRADYLITLLSAESVQSEMVVAEIETAHRLAKSQNGRPTILPVRLCYREPFLYPLSAYLNHINWTSLNDIDQIDRLVNELLKVLQDGVELLHTADATPCAPGMDTSLAPPPAAAQPLLLDLPEGTMDPQSRFYVARPSDREALDVIKREGITMTIKAPRQMGKSSLLIRTLDQAAHEGRKAVLLDFQLFDGSALADANVFFRQFSALLSDELGLQDRTEEFWAMPLGNSQRTTRYIGRYILPELDAPLSLAMDELDTLFDCDFRSDFFGMLRSWHNSRRAGTVWKRLDMLLVTSTEPYHLIDHPNQSPFNVGEIIELPDFTPDDVAELNRRHGNPLGADERQQLIRLMGGHPYLIRRALYLVASDRVSAEKLFSDAAAYGGPFGDHLRYHLYRLRNSEPLIAAFRQILRTRTTPDELVFSKLAGAGLVQRQGREVVPRCELYERFFSEQLHA